MESTQNNCDIKTGICTPNNLTESLTSPLKKEAVEKIKITYFYDALCGWCFGFKNDFEKFKNKYQDQVEFNIINGGLFKGTRVGLINEVAPYIKAGAFKSVEQVTGVKFGDDFVSKIFGSGDIMLNSLPPSIALCIIRENLNTKVLEFSEMLLSAVYIDAINVENISDYKSYVEAIDYDFDTFSSKMQDPKYKMMALNDFGVFSQNKINGMPTLMVEHKNKKEFLSNGFANFNDLELRLETFLKQDF